MGNANQQEVIHQVPCGGSFNIASDEAMCPECGEIITPDAVGLSECSWRARFRTRDGGRMRGWDQTEWTKVSSKWDTFDGKGFEHAALELQTRVVSSALSERDT